MKVAITIFAAIAMAICLAGAILTNVKVWGLVRESWRGFRQLAPEARRRTLRWMVLIYGVVLAEAGVVLSAPFSVRKTLTYFVILPFVVLAPVGLIIVGIRGLRGSRRRRPPM